MTQLESELSALFADAAARIEIRPVPARPSRRSFASTALAAGLAAALVAGIVVVATRFSSDAANRGGAVVPAATQELLDAFARTLAQPIRIETTLDSGQGSAQTSVTKVDADRHELVAYDGNQPRLLVKGTHAYQGISITERQMFGLPAAAQWIRVPGSGREATMLMRSAAGVINVQQLASAINAGRLTVTEVRPHTYRLAGQQQSPAGTTGPDVETVHVSPAGLLDWAKLRSDVPTGNGDPIMHLEVSARISPLGHAFTVELPDPRTVISQRAYDKAANSGSVRTCPSEPSDQPSEQSSASMVEPRIQCFSSTATLRPVKPAKAVKRH